MSGKSFEELWELSKQGDKDATAEMDRRVNLYWNRKESMVQVLRFLESFNLFLDDMNAGFRKLRLKIQDIANETKKA